MRDRCIRAQYRLARDPLPLLCGFHVNGPATKELSNFWHILKARMLQDPRGHSVRDQQARFIDKVRIAAVADLYLSDDSPQKFETCVGNEHSSSPVTSRLQWHGHGYVSLAAIRPKPWA